MSPKIIPVILSGGGGTRLWPLSTKGKPKQLHSLDSRQSLLQGTAGRLRGMSVENPRIVCGSHHGRAVVEQLNAVGIPPELTIVEPIGRNTGPAIAAAALVSEPESILLVFPSDHVVSDEPCFQQAVELAIDEAAAGALVAFGVRPTRPDTGMGYVEPAVPHQPVSDLVRFVEKPDAKTAADLVSRGFLWNSGMFVFEAARIIEALETLAPHVLSPVRVAVEGVRAEDGFFRLGDEFGQAADISIDKAVFELIDGGRVVTLDCGWNDVGTWAALLSDEDEATVTMGEVLVVDSAGSYVRSDTRPVALIGVDGVVVVETPDGVLVVDRSRTQDVRLAADWFEARRRDD